MSPVTHNMIRRKVFYGFGVLVFLIFICSIICITGCSIQILTPTLTPTLTQTPIPTHTSTPTYTPSPTVTSTETPLPTLEASPTPNGWSKHTTDDFEIWLPDHWQEMEMTAEKIQDNLKIMKELFPSNAQQFENILSQPGMLKTMKMYAFDKEKLGISMNIVNQEIPVSIITLNMIMPQME